MVKPSKYLLAFAGLFALLGTGLFVASGKFLPIFLQHTVYYCQSVLSSFSMKVPDEIGTFLTGLLLLLIGYSITKLMVSYVNVLSIRGKLRGQIQQNEIFDQLLSALGLQGDAFLIKSSKPFAFCHGIRHPKIYLSTTLFNLMSASELEAVLRHEQYHLEHKDSLIMLLAEITKSLFPFFPLLSDLIHNYRIEREIKADRHATHNLGTSKPLISVLKKLLLCDPIDKYAFAPALADHETLEMRIKALVNKDYHIMKFSVLNILISILSIVVLMILAIAPVQAIEMHDQKDDIMMVCLQRNFCSSWCKENRTVAPYSHAQMSSAPSTPE